MHIFSNIIYDRVLVKTHENTWTVCLSYNCELWKQQAAATFKTSTERDCWPVSIRMHYDYNVCVTIGNNMTFKFCFACYELYPVSPIIWSSERSIKTFYFFTSEINMEHYKRVIFGFSWEFPFCYWLDNLKIHHKVGVRSSYNLKLLYSRKMLSIQAKREYQSS